MKAIKVMKFMQTSKVSTKGALIKAIAEKPEFKTDVLSGLLQSLATPGSAEVKKNSSFTIPCLRRTKTHRDQVQSEASQDNVKPFAVAALKTQI